MLSSSTNPRFDFFRFIKQPWSIISSMFMHSGLMHILFNMLWLWSLGKTLLQFISDKDFKKLYFYSGIFASIGILLFGYLFDLSGYAVGASGAISGIIFAAIYTRPNDSVSLFGVVKAKMIWIAWGLVVYNIIGLNGNNSGGSVAHLFGALYGYIWIKKHYKRDILKDIISF